MGFVEVDEPNEMDLTMISMIVSIFRASEEDFGVGQAPSGIRVAPRYAFPVLQLTIAGIVASELLSG